MRAISTPSATAPDTGCDTAGCDTGRDPTPATIVAVDARARTIAFGDVTAPCAIGRGGACAADAKREGDGCTPIGRWRVRGVLLRPDRGIPPPARLPWRWLRRDDGWSDDPRDPAYNRPVAHPHPFSAERLWRDDGLYDAILTLGHNDDPPRAGAGSAIFLHLRGGDVTEGCVAVARATMARLLAALAPGDVVAIAQAGAEPRSSISARAVR